MRLALRHLALGVSLLPCAGLLTSCASTQHPGEMAAGSNVSDAPSIDRSKCSDKGKEIVTADTNQDKKPDVWKFFTTVQQGGQSVSVLSCKQVDLNHDGKIDVVQYYDENGNQMTLEEADLD